MNEIVKGSVFEEYIRRGRLANYAKHKLEEEFHKAVIDGNHPLRKVIETAKNEGEEAAMLLFISLLAEIINDNHKIYSYEHPLRPAAILYFLIPATQYLFRKAVKYTRDGNDKLLDGLPLKIVQWAAMQVQEEEANHNRLKFLIEHSKLTKDLREERNRKLHEFANELLMEKKSMGKGHTYSINQLSQIIIDQLSVSPKKARNVRRVISEKMNAIVGQIPC